MRFQNRQPSFVEGAIVALLISICGAVIYLTFSHLIAFRAQGSVNTLILTAGAYLAYLIYRSPRRIGKLVGSICITVVLIVCWLLPLSIISVGVMLIGVIWLARVFYFRAGIVDSFADIGLNVLSVAASLAAMAITHSVFLALWALFITQALHVYLPSLAHRPTRRQKAKERFDQAFENAEAALQQLARRSTSIKP